MNKLLAAFFFISLIIGFQTVWAQFPSIPKIPKIDKDKVKPPKVEETKSEDEEASSTEVKVNPRALSGLDANLNRGDQAIAVDEFGFLDPITIISKSGKTYKARHLKSPNHVYWYQANSIYPNFDTLEFERIMLNNRQYVSSYLECYAKKHNLELDQVADPSHSPNNYGNAEKMRAALQKEFPKLAEIESQLKSKLQSRPNTFLNYQRNPAIWEEIVTNKTQYLDCAIGNEDAKPDPFLNAFLDEIAETQKEIENYSPETKIYLISIGKYDWLKRAVSKKAREEWLNQWTKNPAQRQQFSEALDAVAAAAARKLPLYTPKLKNYSIHNPVEEKLMKSKINDLADHKIHYIGLEQANWLIEKNSLGIPTARFKRGLVWVRYTPNDHPYCRIYYINIIQDYAGGGTYGASYGKFLTDELAGCPTK